MDKTELLRRGLAKLVSDTMGKECGELFYKFHIDDNEDALVDGTRALLLVMLGPEMTSKKIERVRQKL